MKIKKSLLAATLVLSATSFASMADQGHGSVTFIGSIIDAPCSISPDSVDQTVNLGAVSNVELNNGGSSSQQPFDIKLENCALSTAKTVTTTFTGQKGPEGRLAITGTAKGASIALTSFDGTPVELGSATEAQSLQDGDNTLKFYASLQGDGASGASAAVTPGDFQSVADFTLAYQ